MTRVKICGVTTLADAVLCADAGAWAVGLNFWPGTRRRVEEDVARLIVAEIGTRVRVVGVFVDAGVAEVERVRGSVGLRWIQLHGSESEAELAALSPNAYKAYRVSDSTAIDLASRSRGELVLLDASVPGQVGGTGKAFDWDLAVGLAREREIILAGGLDSHNVAEAIERVGPYAVDVASGVESEPGKKDASLVRAFVTAARQG